MKTDDIRKAVDAVRVQRPAYSAILDFYEKVFFSQETSRENIRSATIDIASTLAAVKQAEGFPLVAPDAFEVDTEAALVLFKELCRHIPETNPLLKTTGSRLADALDKGMVKMEELFAPILKGDDQGIGKAALAMQVDKAALTFLVFHSILPSLCAYGERLSAHLDGKRRWDKGYCPVCGTPPALSILRKEGKRFLVCGFCRHEWESLRLFCPFCENRDQKKLHYFFGQEEKECRVDVCDVCNRYIKSIDGRNLARPLHASLEQIATLHLDMLAQEKGLQSGLPLWLQM